MREPEGSKGDASPPTTDPDNMDSQPSGDTRGVDEEESPRKRVRTRLSVMRRPASEGGAVDYPNHTELVELLVCLLLPSGRTRNLRALVDTGATSNFLSKEVCEEYNIKRESYGGIYCLKPQGHRPYNKTMP